MTKFPSQVSRRQFLVAAGASALGSVVLHSCTASSSSPDNQAQSTPAVNVGSGEGPETATVKLGFIPVVESAPMIVAKEKGFFAKYGMTDVQVSKQASWGVARDNVEIGSAGGGIDGGQWQLPMPHLISEGKITKGNQKIPMYTLLMLNTQGNGIAIAGKHKDAGIGLDVAKAAATFERLKAEEKAFTAAFTFPGANQEFWMRYWLAAGGIDPDQQTKLLVIPSAQTVANLKTGSCDAFSTGDPWPYRIVKDQIGFMAALTAQMWKNHPEEYFALRADWVDAHPKATKALLKGLIEAQQWCDDFANRPELATILSKQKYFNTPVAILSDPLLGKIDLGTGQVIEDQTLAVRYWNNDGVQLSYPYKSHDLWFLTESQRWGYLAADTDTQAIVDKVNRADLWQEAAQDLGLPAANIPQQTSRGVEKFFDGTEFDPANPSAYLKSLKIKKI